MNRPPSGLLSERRTGLVSERRAHVSAGARAESGTSAAASDTPKVIAAGPGRVEGAQETLNLGIGVDGVIKEIRVSAGDLVSAAQVLAVIDRDDLQQEEVAAAAALEGARSRKLRLLRGGREEARRQAVEESREAAAIAEEAQIRFSRMESLFRAGAAAAAERDQAKRDFEAAEARVRAAAEAFLLVKAEPLPEEVQQVDAAVTEAEARLHLARARLKQGTIVAPYGATILKVHVRAGETVTPLHPQPVMTIADLSRLRIRAEVDERDLARVTVGQVVRVDVGDVPVGDGEVTWVAPVMGRKRTSTGDPAEKADRDVREVLVDLQNHKPLVVDQRVTVKFLLTSDRPE